MFLRCQNEYGILSHRSIYQFNTERNIEKEKKKKKMELKKDSSNEILEYIRNSIHLVKYLLNEVFFFRFSKIRFVAHQSFTIKINTDPSVVMNKHQTISYCFLRYFIIYRLHFELRAHCVFNIFFLSTKNEGNNQTLITK